MASNIKLKNNIETEFSITHKDNTPAKSIDTDDLTYTRATVADMEAISNPQDGDVCFVKDLDRGGSFIYDSSEVGNDNQGTNFNGWIRQYSGAVNNKWFGNTEHFTFSSSITIQAGEADNDAVTKAQLDYVATIGNKRSLALIMLGQSNSISRSPKVTTQYDLRLKTFNGGSEHGDYSSGNIENPTPENQMSSLVAFSEFSRDAESWGPGFSDAVNRYTYDEIMFYAAGIGARAYRRLKLGNGIFGEMLVADRNFKNLAKNTSVDRVFILDHGEADAAGIEPGTLLPETPVGNAEYLSIIQDWRNTILSYTNLMNGSSKDAPIMLISSMNYSGLSTDDKDTAYHGVQNAQLEAGLTIPGTYMIGAKYQFEFETDHIHITGLGKRFYAEKAAHVYNRILTQGYWKPLYIKSASELTSTTVEVTFNVPDNGNLVIDTDTVKSTELTHPGSKYGFEIYVDGIQVPISTATITGANKILLTTSTGISGTIKELRIAQLNESGAANASENLNRSNIRSDANVINSIYDNTVKLYDWAVPQSLSF